MNILYIETSQSGVVGGSFYSLLELIRGIDIKKNKPTVLFYHENHLIPRFRNAGATVYCYKENASSEISMTEGKPFLFRRPHFGKLLEYCEPFRSIATLLTAHHQKKFADFAASIIDQSSIDLIHINDGLTPGLPFFSIARKKHIPVVIHERKIRKYTCIEASFLKNVEWMICISQTVAENVRRNFPSFNRLSVVSNPLSTDITKKETCAKPLPAPNSGPVILQVSNIVSWKGQDTLIEAIAKVVKVYPACRLWLVGGTLHGEENYAEKLNGLIEAYGLKNHVIFAGFVEKPQAWYKAADLVVHVPTKPEPSGRIVLDAMQLGKAIITRDTGGTAELIQDGVSGFLIPHGNSALLAEKILELLAKPDLSEAIGLKAKQVSTERFNIQNIVKQIEAIYGRVT